MRRRLTYAATNPKTMVQAVLSTKTRRIDRGAESEAQPAGFENLSILFHLAYSAFSKLKSDRFS